MVTPILSIYALSYSQTVRLEPWTNLKWYGPWPPSNRLSLYLLLYWQQCIRANPDYGLLWSFCNRNNKDLAADIIGYAIGQIQREIRQNQVVYTNAILRSNSLFTWPKFRQCLYTCILLMMHSWIRQSATYACSICLSRLLPSYLPLYFLCGSYLPAYHSF